MGDDPFRPLAGGGSRPAAAREAAKAGWRTEKELEAEADRVRPPVLGALLSAVASALRHREAVPPVQLPSMADSATFIWRACPGLGWEPKAFLDAYEKNQAAGAEIAFEADGLGTAVADLIALRKPDDDGLRRWVGTSTKLLDDLPIDEKGHKAKWWPAPNQVRNRLRRLQETLAARGVILELDIPGHDKGRLIKITQQPG
jgi:putative DNA primase/helicase